MNSVKIARRTFLHYSAAAAAAAPLGAIPLLLRADGHRLGEDDPAARALGYRHAAADVDAGQFPRYVDGQLCENCVLYEPEPEGWGGCGVLPGKQVSAGGWCNAYAPKQG